MSVSVVGVGGTGKAVVNIIGFASTLASALTEAKPTIRTLVVDQDTEGVWEGTSIVPAAPGVGGSFADWLQLRDWRAQAAARSLFTGAELDVDMSRGFHERPRVAATVVGDDAVTLRSDGNIQVVVYSAIGGTGAGVGPVVLRQLLKRQQARHVVALVFGRYLDRGPSAAIAFRWLDSSAKLAIARDERWFTCRFIDVPTLHPRREAAPPSGLNEHPALLMAADFIWQLGEADEQGAADDFLGIGGRRTHEEVRSVSYSAWTPASFTLDDEKNRTLISRCRDAAQRRDLLPLVAHRGYLANAVNAELRRTPLAEEVWEVFEAPLPEGTPPGISFSGDAEFAETFEAVPDPLAAVDWFHRSVVAEPASTVADLFRMLIGLYLGGQLSVFPTGWSARGQGEVYALLLGPFEAGGPDARTRFSQQVVGFLTPDLPPWTTAELAERLRAAGRARGHEGHTPTMQIDETTVLGSAIRIGGGQIQLPSSTEAPLAIALASVTPAAGWRWSLSFGAADWSGLHETIETCGLLKNAVAVNRGGVNVDDPLMGYSCEVRGIHIFAPVFADLDEISVGAFTGPQYFDLTVKSTSAPIQTARVLRPSFAGREAQLVPQGAVSVLVGNTRITLRGDGQ
jgi:hypothetical protein